MYKNNEDIPLSLSPGDIMYNKFVNYLEWQLLVVTLILIFAIAFRIVVYSANKAECEVSASGNYCLKEKHEVVE